MRQSYSADNAPRKEKNKDLPAIPLHNSAMNCVLVNIAHQGIQCQSTNGLPAIRAMGFFPSRDHAYNHLKKILKRKLADEIPYFVIDAFSKFVIPLTMDRTEEYLTRKAKTLYEGNMQKNQAEKETFQKRIGTTMDEKAILDDFKRLRKKREEEAEEKQAFYQQDVHEDDTFVSRDAEVRAQRYAAVGIINDPDKSLNEPMVCIYAGFETEDTCVRYIEDTLSDEEESMHLYCVDMYQWLYPTLTDNKGLMQEIPQSYRHTDLNNWMNGKKNQENIIKKIKETNSNYKNSKKQEVVVDSDEFGDDEQKV
jgi:hypothetical protein